MRWIVMIGLFAATTCLAQEPATSQPGQPEKSAEQAQAATPAQTQAIIVPAGTRIPVKLTYSLWSKTARVGDSIHAVTVFPVTVGTTVAIPAGTYAEGVVDKVWKRASGSHPAMQLHFTQLLFANGYTLALDSATTEVMERLPETVPAFVAATYRHDGYEVPARMMNVAGNTLAVQLPAQQPPVLTPPPNPGPSKALVIGGAVAGLATVLVTLAVLGHRAGGYTLLDAGSQIDLVLQSPLTLDAGEVAKAVATPNAQ